MGLTMRYPSCVGFLSSQESFFKGGTFQGNLLHKSFKITSSIKAFSKLRFKKPFQKHFAEMGTRRWGSRRGTPAVFRGGLGLGISA